MFSHVNTVHKYAYTHVNTVHKHVYTREDTVQKHVYTRVATVHKYAAVIGILWISVLTPKLLYSFSANQLETSMPLSTFVSRSLQFFNLLYIKKLTDFCSLAVLEETLVVKLTNNIRPCYGS